MVLSDVEIQAEIVQQRLVFDPPITDPAGRIDSSAVDLLLHRDLILLPSTPVPGVTIVPNDDEVDVMRLLSNNGETKVNCRPPLPYGTPPIGHRQNPRNRDFAEPFGGAD